MALKKYKPRSCGMRFRESATFEEITEKRPVKRLTKAVRKTAGRNNQGRITTRHHGGGAKQRMRIVDFKRNKFDVEATVKDIAYDPTRSAYLALIEYTDGVKNYILAPEGLKPGMKVMNGPKAEATVGNCLPLSQIPLGLFVHAVELVPGRGASVARSAGNACQVMARDGGRCLRAKSASSTAAASPRSARSATRTGARSSSARLAASATSAFVRRFAVSP